MTGLRIALRKSSGKFENQVRILRKSNGAMIYNLGRALEFHGQAVTYLFRNDLVNPSSVAARFLDLKFAFWLAEYIRKNRNSSRSLTSTAHRFSLRNIQTIVSFSFQSPLLFWHCMDWKSAGHTSCVAKIVRVAPGISAGKIVFGSLLRLSAFSLVHSHRGRCSYLARDTWKILQLKSNLDADGDRSCTPNGVESRFFVARNYQNLEPLRRTAHSCS